MCVKIVQNITRCCQGNDSLYISYRVVDGVRPGLCLQTHPSMLLNGHSILPHVRTIQKISRVELDPWLVCVHYQTMP